MLFLTFRDFFFLKLIRVFFLKIFFLFKRLNFLICAKTGIAGIEPTRMILKTIVLPLNYTPKKTS